MLTITIPSRSYINEADNSLINIKETTLVLEHSLVSISKWESKFHKPFFSKKEMTEDEILYYVKCMTITQNVNPWVYLGLTDDNINQIIAYMEDPMTATWFSNIPGKTKSKTTGRVITSELIYYLLAQYNIPVKFEKWHINRLMTLIRIFDEQNQPTKKMSKKDIMRRNQAINARNRAKFKSKG